MFNLYAQLEKELDDFKRNKIHLAGIDSVMGTGYLRKNNKGYDFSQRETIDLIDLYYNSRFESGELDAEGQRKLFLNICKFRSNVASKMIDLDTKDFIFVPTEGKSIWGSYFLSKEFKSWAKENYFGDLLNEIVENLPRYGTIVIKKVGSELQRVQLAKLRNQQDAKDLMTARYIIEEHPDMALHELEEMDEWDTKNLNMGFDDRVTVYERYGRVPLSFYKKYQKMEVEEGDDQKTVDTMSILLLNAKKKKEDEATGYILFLEKIVERPYLEVHWDHQDGRWLGIGEVENQFENQIARNMIANQRRRALLWSSKKVFQSPDENVAKNLVRDVKDGDVLRIMPNGNITQIDMTTHELSEFNATEQTWEQNSDQKSFTFEVATGESLPSGTPFRLGVVLSNSVQSHFDLKREKLGLFLKKVIEQFVLGEFKKQKAKEHTVSLFASEEGVNELRSIMIDYYTTARVKEEFFSKGRLPNIVQIRGEVEKEMQEKKYLFVNLPDSFYNEVKASTQLTITGEEINLKTKIETYNTVMQLIASNPTILQNPATKRILTKTLSLLGENLDVLVGGESFVAQPQQGQPGATPQEASPLSQMGVMGEEPQQI